MKLNELKKNLCMACCLIISSNALALEIVSAKYRSIGNGRGPDVTTQVKEQCKGAINSCEVICSNNMAGDPHPGTPKSCDVSYRCEKGGDVKNKSGAEEQKFTLDCS